MWRRLRTVFSAVFQVDSVEELHRHFSFLLLVSSYSHLTGSGDGSSLRRVPDLRLHSLSGLDYWADYFAFLVWLGDVLELALHPAQ